MNTQSFTHKVWPKVKAALKLTGEATSYILKRISFSNAPKGGVAPKANALIPCQTNTRVANITGGCKRRKLNTPSGCSKKPSSLLKRSHYEGENRAKRGPSPSLILKNPITTTFCPCSSVVEHVLGKDEATGSIPVEGSNSLRSLHRMREHQIERVDDARHVSMLIGVEFDRIAHMHDHGCIGLE
jgi:hypothetical protein